MSNNRAGFRALVLGAMAVCITANLVGVKADQGNNGTLRIAMFDYHRVVDESKFLADANKALQQKQDDTKFMLNIWAQNALLPEADQKRLGDLALEERTAGANFDPKKKDEMKKLQETSANLLNQLTSLQGNQNPTQQQQDRLKILTRDYSDTRSRIETVDKTVYDELQKQNQANSTKALKDMRDAVGQVAKAKGYGLVLTNDVAFFSENDITDAVVTAMNKK